jgi:hypothetical protein
MDQGHAALVEDIVGLLRGLGWSVATEVSFNIQGERGSIDVLAYHPGHSVLLVVEANSVVPDLQSMLVTLDRKSRLAHAIGAEREWRAGAVGRLLVLPADRTARRRVARHHATFASVLPACSCHPVATRKLVIGYDAPRARGERDRCPADAPDRDSWAPRDDLAPIRGRACT